MSSLQSRLAQAWLDTPAAEAAAAWETELGGQTRQFLSGPTPELHVQGFPRQVLERAITLLYQQPDHWGAYLCLRLFRREFVADVAAPEWFRQALAHIDATGLSTLQILPKPQDFRITVLVPTFNRLSTLKRTVAAVRGQRFRDWELIICDDCSSDGTENYCQALPAQDPRIRYLRNAQNQGLGKTTQRLCEAAQTELVTVCADDDWFYPDHLAENMDFFKIHPWIGLISGGIHLVSPERQLVRQHGPYYPQSVLADNLTELQRCALICPVGPGVIQRKSLLREFAPLDHLTCKNGETYASWDYLLMAKIAGKYEFAYNSRILGSMEVNPHSNYSSKDFSQEMISLLVEILKDYQRLAGPLTYPSQLTETYLSHIARTLRHFHPTAQETADDPVWGPFLAARETFLAQSDPAAPLKVNPNNPYTYKPQWLWALERRLLRWGLRSLPPEPVQAS